MSLAGDRRRSARATAASGIRFLVVGGVATVATIGVFNLLTHVGGRPPLADAPIPAYAIGLVVGLAVNYLGNRFWAFRSGRPASLGRQLVSFLVVNGVAFAIPAICLAVTRYGFGLNSVLADNVSANVVGLILASTARWLLYRRVVFPTAPEPP